MHVYKMLQAYVHAYVLNHQILKRLYIIKEFGAIQFNNNVTNIKKQYMLLFHIDSADEMINHTSAYFFI